MKITSSVQENTISYTADDTVAVTKIAGISVTVGATVYALDFGKTLVGMMLYSRVANQGTDFFSRLSQYAGATSAATLASTALDFTVLGVSGGVVVNTACAVIVTALAAKTGQVVYNTFYAEKPIAVSTTAVIKSVLNKITG